MEIPARCAQDIAREVKRTKIVRILKVGIIGIVFSVLLTSLGWASH